MLIQEIASLWFLFCFRLWWARLLSSLPKIKSYQENRKLVFALGTLYLASSQLTSISWSPMISSISSCSGLLALLGTRAANAAASRPAHKPNNINPLFEIENSASNNSIQLIYFFYQFYYFEWNNSIFFSTLKGFILNHVTV